MEHLLHIAALHNVPQK